jgi:hypothetical protein
VARVGWVAWGKRFYGSLTLPCFKLGQGEEQLTDRQNFDFGVDEARLALQSPDRERVASLVAAVRSQQEGLIAAKFDSPWHRGFLSVVDEAGQQDGR